MASTQGNRNPQDGASSPAAGLEVEDAVDRAMRYRRMDKTRIDLGEIGFWPGNRGGVGINSIQVHRVCEDIMRQKCRIQRYDHVDLVEVPEPMLTDFKAVNLSLIHISEPTRPY